MNVLRLAVAGTLLLIVGAITPTSPAQDAAATPAPAARRQVVLYQPIVVADDDGKNAAQSGLGKREVDALLATAECLYLEPTTWSNGAVLRGQVPFDTVVKLALEKRVASGDRRVIPLMFVSAIEGDSKPAVRRADDGRIRVVCLGNTKNTDAAATELVQDAHRLAPAAKDQDPPGTSDRIVFHNTDEGRRLLVDETWEPYSTDAPDDMVRFSLGLKADDPIPAAPTARRGFIVEKYGEQVLAFTEEEREVLRRVVARLAEKTGGDWPLVSRFPWQFIKVRSTFCRGMAHTRGLAIVFSEGNLRRLSADESGAMKLLLHEKLHVLQRVCGPRFAPLYRDLGWAPVALVPGEDQRLNIAQNPDALRLNWARPQGDSHVLLVTLLSRRADGQFAFESQLRVLERRDGQRFAIGQKAPTLADFEAWQRTFAVRSGFDHPNELTAYLSSVLLDADYLKPRAPADAASEQPTLATTRRGFKKALELFAE